MPTGGDVHSADDNHPASLPAGGHLHPADGYRPAGHDAAGDCSADYAAGDSADGNNPAGVAAGRQQLLGAATISRRPPRGSA